MSNFRRALDIVANEQRNRGTRQAVPTAGSEFRRILKQKAAEQSSRIDELRAEADRVNASTKHLEDAYMRAAEKRPQSTQPQWVNNLSDSDAARLKNELSRYRPQRKAGETDAQMMERLGRAAEREWKTTDAALAAMGTSRVELRQQQKAPWADNLSDRDAARLQSELAAAANPNAAAHDVANLTRKYDEVSAKLSNISTSLPDAERTRQAQALGDKASAYEQQIKDRQNGAALVQRYLREFERNTYERDIMNAPDFAEMSAKGAADSDLDSKRHMINTVHLAQYGDGSDPVYGEMTEDEKGIFNYLWAARGKDEAEKYLKRLEETLSERAGRRLAESVLNEENGFLRGVGSVTLGITSGFENAASGIKQTFTKEAITPTAGQYAAGYVRSELDGGAAFLFDLSQSAANMTPSILLSSVTAGIGGAVGMSAGAAGTLGQVMGAVEMGLQSRGNAISEKLREGYTYEQASLYGTLVGASEGGLQYLLGGISKLGGRLTGGKVAAKIAAIDNAFGRIALKLGTSMASEGLEEGLQEILEPIFAALILNEEYEPAKWNEVAYAALLGAVSAGLFEGVSTFGEDSARRSTGKEIAALGSDTVQAVIDAGLKSDRNSMAYKVAQELQSRQAAGKTITPHALGEVYAEVIGTSGAELGTVFEAAKKRQAETAANDAADSEEVVSEKEITTPEDTAAVAERGQGGFESSEYDEGTSAKLRKSLDILGQATGRTYRFIDEIDVGAGATANGLYDGNTVWLSRASRNPLTTAASHETGHILADSAPDAWADFVSYAVGKKGEGAVRQAYELYSSRGLINTVAAAQEEVASDYLGEMLSNEDTLRSFTRDIEHGMVKRNTVQKILDAIRRFIARVRGKTTEQRIARDMGITISEATRAVDMITRAMNVTAAAQQTTAAPAQQSDMEAAPEQVARRVAASYSIKSTPNGDKYVEIDTDQHLFDNAPKKSYAAIARRVLLDRFAGQTLPLGENDLARLEANQTGEYAYPRKQYEIHSAEYAAKMRAATELDNLLETAEYSHWAKDTKNHKEATLGFDYYKTKFVVDGHSFEGLVNIANSESGRIFYDITKIEEIPDTRDKPATGMAQSASSFGNLDTNSISESGEDVNAKFSLSADERDAQIHSEAFKRWFGDWQNDPEHASKVVDENGAPLVVYHATWSEPFTVFDRSLLGNITDGNATDPVFAATAHIGFWFNTQNLMGSAGKRSEAVYINIRNPYIAMSVENLSREIEEYAGVYNDGEYDAAASGEAFADLLATRGYDGIEVEDEEFGGTSFVVLHPEQIKSATGNIGTFDRKNPDIRFSLSAGEDSEGNRLSTGQSEFFRDSKARDEQGRLLKLYHQTENEFTVFNPRHKGAGSRDDGTPFGIFLKSSDGDIGLNGKKQMALYANIENPLTATSRDDLSRKLRQISPTYDEIIQQHEALDKEYQEKFDAAKTAWRDYITKWREENPTGNRSELYNVPEFNRLFEAEDTVVDEWTEKADALSLRAKEMLTSALRDAGYDGVFLLNDVGSFGRRTDAYIALDPEQVKRIDNIYPTTNPDIRFSLSGGETPYNGTVVLDKDTVDKYLMDYASKSSPKYAQAYIAYMTPEQFLELTTSIAGRHVIEAQSRALDAAEFGDVQRQVPIQLSIDHETGEVNGHEGRHRAAALLSEGIRRVPVLLFDSSNKLSKTPIETLDLHGQDFGTSRSYATVTVENLLPLSYENRAAVVETYSKAPSLERAMERYGMKQSLRYFLEENENAEASADPNLADPSPSAEAIEKAEIEAELAEEDARRADRLVLPSVEDEVINRLPKKAKDYLRRVERKFVWKFSDALSVPRKARKGFLDGVVRSISAAYLDIGTIPDSTLDRLFNQAYDAGVVVDRQFYDQYKDIRNHIRKQPLSISEWASADIPDFWAFRRKAFGEVMLSNDGLPVDSAYDELRTMAPELFPSGITHPADQLMRIVDVAKSIRISERTINEYLGADAATFRKWARNDFGAAVGEFENELRVVSRYEKEANTPDDVAMPAPRTVAEANEVYAALKEARRNLARVERQSLLTSEDEQTVGRLLRGELQLRHVEKRTNYAAIREMYEAKAEYEKYSKQIREYREQLKKAKRAEAEELLETSDTWKDKKAGLLYSRETMERNIRDIVPDAELAEKIIEKYFTPIHTAEAGATRMKNRMRDRVRALNLSRKVKKGDVVSESHAVQLYGEASDNIQMLRDNPRMEMRDGKTLEEWNTVLRELWEQNPGIDRAKIENAAEVFHSIYDELFGLMNEARVRNGYEPVNYRKGYFPHFEEGGSDGLLVSFAKSLGIDSNVTALPTTINGLTHTFKPGITWFGHALERVGWNTVYDAVEGFDRYIEGAAAVIYQTDNIQNLRALASQIRYRAGDEQIKKDADEIRNNTALDDDTQEEKINELYEGRRYALSAFVVELEEYTNLLAGKKSSHDRNMESDFGRWAYNLVKKAASRVGGNMVVANLSSAATNFIPLTQGWSMVSSRDMLRGMWDTLKALKSPDGFASQSTFLTNRRGSDPLVRTVAQDLSAKGSMPMTWIDEFTSDSLVRARYAQNKRKGLSDSAAMSEADAWAAGVMADRSKGSTPTLFQRQNPLAKLFTQFQLEVNNQLSFVAKDMKHEARTQNYGKRQIVAMILKFIAGAWLYDELYEYIFGRRPALDPIGILNDTVGDMTGYTLPNVVSMGVGLAQGKAPNFTTEKKSVDAVLGNLAENLGGELPFVGGVLFEGGRLPISSAIPDVGNLIKAATNSEWSASKRWSTAGKELFKPVSYLLLPFGGGQLKKVIDGMTAVVQGGSYSLDSDGRKKLQYPVFSDGIWGTMSATTKALLFGKSSFSGAQEWVDSGFKTMNADATATYLGLRSAGMKDRDAYEAVKGLLSVEDKAERRLMLSEGSIPAEMKFVVYRGMLTASDKEAELLDELLGMGADSGAVVDTMLALHAPADVIKLEGEDVEKDPGVPSELKQFAAALRGEQVDFAEEEEVEKSESAAKLRRDALLASKLSPRERAVVYYAMGASESDKGLMEELVKLDADMGAAAELIIRMKDEPKNAGKYDLVRESGLKEREKDAVCARIMGDSGYDKLTEARGAGISVDIYLEYLSATAGLEGDLDENGKTISGSKKEKVMAEINALSLTAAQKNVLYLHAGYSEKTIDEAPWNRGGLSLPRVK